MALDFLPLLGWLTEASLDNVPAELAFGGLCERLNAGGLGIERAHISAAALHPMVGSFSLDWAPGQRGTRNDHEHQTEVHPAWRDSPLQHMLNNRVPHMRHRLDRPNAPLEFPVLQEFAGTGLTDYAAFMEGFGWRSTQIPGGEYGILASFATRREGGFDDADVAALRFIIPPLALAVKTSFIDSVAHDVLAAYLGAEPARRVLSGAITRGGVTQLAAVIMMADIKDFTRFSNTRPIANVVNLLNDCFELITKATEAAGGHILKFVGDGALAIFLLEDRAPADAAAAALAAAEAIQHALPAGIGVDIGLNIGDVHYGNVGASGRLDFTAIGPAVNEAARLETMCAPLGQRILLSGALAALVPQGWRNRLVALGDHPMRGFDGLRPVFALPAAD